MTKTKQRKVQKIEHDDDTSIPHIATDEELADAKIAQEKLAAAMWEMFETVGKVEGHTAIHMHNAMTSALKYSIITNFLFIANLHGKNAEFRKVHEDLLEGRSDISWSKAFDELLPHEGKELNHLELMMLAEFGILKKHKYTG